jgi:uncharacterized protein (TIGR03118 family)
MKLSSVHWCSGLGLLAIGLAGCAGSSSNDNNNTSQYMQTNLVGSKAGQAARQDTNLVKAWGLAQIPTGPWWVSANGTGKVLAINGDGSATAILVTVPAVSGVGPVTGQVFNGTTDFAIPAVGPSHFIFDSEDGLISAWNAGSAAVTVSDQSATGAIFKGLAMGVNNGNNFLYATDFHNNQVDVFDKNFVMVSHFTDPTLPAGFAPFGIQNIDGQLYVTFAQQDAAKEDELHGAGLGYVDIFNTDGTFVSRFAGQGALNAPWAVVKAPADFGSAGGTILVGNFGDGKINSYGAINGNFNGPLQNFKGHPITIVGLWGLAFGNGGSAGATNKLFFTSGPRDEQDGLFGTITQTF